MGGGKKNKNYCYIGGLHFSIHLASLLKSIIEAVHSVHTHTHKDYTHNTIHYFNYEQEQC